MSKSYRYLTRDGRFVIQNWVEHLGWLVEKTDKFSWLKVSNVYQKLRGE